MSLTQEEGYDIDFMSSSDEESDAKSPTEAKSSATPSRKRKRAALVDTKTPAACIDLCDSDNEGVECIVESRPDKKMKSPKCFMCLGSVDIKKLKARSLPITPCANDNCTSTCCHRWWCQRANKVNKCPCCKQGMILLYPDAPPTPQPLRCVVCEEKTSTYYPLCNEGCPVCASCQKECQRPTYPVLKCGCGASWIKTCSGCNKLTVQYTRIDHDTIYCSTCHH